MYMYNDLLPHVMLLHFFVAYTWNSPKEDRKVREIMGKFDHKTESDKGRRANAMVCIIPPAVLCQDSTSTNM